jgi:hypothetical protein
MRSVKALEPLIFCTKCNFLQVLDLLIFLQKQPGHWGRGCLHFHLTFISLLCLPNGNGNYATTLGILRACFRLFEKDAAKIRVFLDSAKCFSDI